MFNFLDISHPLRCFTILSPIANIGFPFFSPFGLSFSWSSVVIVFGGLQILSNDLTTPMFLLTFLDVSTFLLFILLNFFFFIAEASWSIFVLAFLAVNSFCVITFNECCALLALVNWKSFCGENPQNHFFFVMRIRRFLINAM